MIEPGWNVIEKDADFTCQCGWEGNQLGTSDSFKTVLFSICPNCKEEIEVEL